MTNCHRNMRTIKGSLGKIPEVSASVSCSGCFLSSDVDLQHLSSQQWNQEHSHWKVAYDVQSRLHLLLVNVWPAGNIRKANQVSGACKDYLVHHTWSFTRISLQSIGVGAINFKRHDLLKWMLSKCISTNSDNNSQGFFCWQEDIIYYKLLKWIQRKRTSCPLKRKQNYR